MTPALTLRAPWDVVLPACPPSSRRYCKPQHAFYDLAADVIAENPQYVAKHLSPDLQDFLQATIMRQVRTRALTVAVPPSANGTP